MATKKRKTSTSRARGRAKRAVARAVGGTKKRTTRGRRTAQPDLMTRARRTLRKAADTAVGVTRTAIDTVRR